MESTVWSVESREALAALAAALAASVAALAALTGSGESLADPSGIDPSGDAGQLRGADPLRDLADACLDGLAGMPRVEAGMAALKVLLAADYAKATRALAPPAASARDRSVQEMVIVSEVACALTVSEHTAGALLGESEALTTRLPLTLEALQAGTISWAARPGHGG